MARPRRSTEEPTGDCQTGQQQSPVVMQRRRPVVVSLRVVKDDAESVAMAGTYPAHTVTCIHAIAPAAALHRPMTDRKDHAAATFERQDFSPRLHSRPLLGQHELAAREVVAGLGEQKRDLQRKHMFSVEILVQAVVVAFAVLQHQRRSLGLSGLLATFNIRLVLGRRTSIPIAAFHRFATSASGVYRAVRSAATSAGSG